MSAFALSAEPTPEVWKTIDSLGTTVVSNLLVVQTVTPHWATGAQRLYERRTHDLSGCKMRR